MSHEPKDVRNLCLVGHSDAGKTALVDAAAHRAGVVSRRGSTADGTSLCDFEPEEKEKKHSLTSAIVRIPWKKRVFHWIDCPGYPDFVGDSHSALAAVETAVVVVNATQGPTFNTGQRYAEAERAGLARAFVVTRCDGENVDFGAVLGAIREAFGDRVVPVTFPDGTGSAFGRVVDVLAPGDLPGPLAAQAEEFRTTLVERAVEADDALLERYLTEGAVSDEEIARVFPRAMATGVLLPLFVVDPVRDLGVAEFLDRVDWGFPSPLDVPARKAKTPAGEAVEVAADPEGPLAAFVFKTLTDPYVGKVVYFRIFRGSLRADGTLPNPKSGRAEKLTSLGVPVGRDLKGVDRAGPGDLVAVAKIEGLEWGESICAEAAPVVFARPDQPVPMTALAIEPKSRTDEAKLSGALQKLAVEDPTFRIRRDPDTRELCIEGLSDLHLQVMLARLKRRFGVEVETRLPKVPYRETVQAHAEGHYRHKKQTGGRGQFGECYVKIEPRERGAGFEFVDEVFGGSIPRQFIPAVEKGIREAMEKGVMAGCPVVDVCVRLTDGKHHEVDSDEASFKIAGARAFRDAFEKARPVLLEPIVTLDITVPVRYLGDITGDLNSRRGRIVGMDSNGALQTIRATAPLSEVLSYSAQLRSITAGEGTYATSFSHHEILPAHLAEKIVGAFRAAKKADED